jgi:DNA-binding transcriptional LysR family regulator
VRGIGSGFERLRGHRDEASALKALATAVDEGSLRGAARRLGVTQPTLTKAIRELERELGTPLFERTGRGVVPTPAGRILHEHASAATRELGRAVERIGELTDGTSGELRVAAIPLAVMVLMPETVRTFCERWPDVRLHVNEELYMAQLARLRRGEVDLAIGPMPEILAPGEFDVQPLMPITMRVMVRRGSPLHGPATLRELANERWVYTSASGMTGYARQMYESHGLDAPRAGAIVDSTLSLLTLIASADFVGLVPEPIARHPMVEPWMRVLPTREAPFTTMLASLTRKGRVVAPVVREFGVHLHRAAARLGGAGAASSAVRPRRSGVPVR